MTTYPLGISAKRLNQVLVSVVVGLALLAGYYHSLWEQEVRRYNRLEDMFVRVRGELGREETQRLIDQSYQKETTHE